MGKNEQKPAIRFRGFTDPWEQRKVIDVAPLQRGFDLPTSQMKDGPYPVVMSNGIGGYHSAYKVKGPGVVTGRSGTIGKLHYIEDSYWPHNTALWVTDFKGNLPKFIYHLYQRMDLSYFGSGSGVPTLNRNDVHDAMVFIPSEDEQVKISKALDSIDNLITLHQRKYDKLVNVKKSLLEKMFPRDGASVPEIRFAGFTNPWEQRKLSEVNTYFTDGNYGEAYPKASDMTDSSSGVPFLTGGNIKQGRLDLAGASFITKEKHEKLTSGHLIQDDIVIAVRGSLGALGYVNKGNSGWNINSQLAIIRTDKSVLNGAYLMQYLLSDAAQADLISRQTGSALKQLPIGQIKDVEVPITSIEEQNVIGTFFGNLDNLITLHQRKREKLKNIKKSMLEKMFV